MKRRKTRAEANEENRRAILDAAEHHFELHGYHGASLDGIAEAAGFSKGAVYSRFEGKDDLFLAVVEDRIERRHRQTERRLAERDGPLEMKDIILMSMRANIESLAWQVALLEFRAHAWRDPVVNERYASLHRRTIDSIAGFMGEYYRRRGEKPPLPLELLAVVGLAEGTGVVAEYMSDPGLDLAVVAEAMAAPAEWSPVGRRT